MYKSTNLEVEDLRLIHLMENWQYLSRWDQFRICTMAARFTFETDIERLFTDIWHSLRAIAYTIFHQ